MSSHLSTQGLWGFREGLHFPRGHETSRLHVIVTDGTVGKCQMGTQHVSLSPHLLQKPLTQASPCRQQRLRCLAGCLLSGVLFDFAACAPYPGIRRNHRQQRPLEGHHTGILALSPAYISIQLYSTLQPILTPQTV